jgi:hypothetical protein
MPQQPNNFNFNFEKEMLAQDNYGLDKLVAPYHGSSVRQQTYEDLQKEDLEYQKFIIRTYGSYDNFSTIKNINTESDVFDPGSDYIIETTVITDEKELKTDHISSDEILLEMLSGVCTVFFIKKTTGSSRKLTCTLQEKYIPSTQKKARQNFFSPMAGDRIGVWDLNQRTWKSFYMSNVFKFVRDDTTDLE